MQRILFPTVKPNATIQVEKEAVEVNSYLLALSSDYFDRYFFDNHYPKAENIELPPSTTVEDFRRMLATLYGHKLDDDCIEAVTILADRFAMDNVMLLCRKFLQSFESKKPNLFYFRMAHNYEWKEIKDQFLRNMQYMHLNDFNGRNFFDNAVEFAMLDEEGKEALLARHTELLAGSETGSRHFSAYFDRYFFDTRYSPAENIELPETTTVEDFKRLVAVLSPEQHPLDDDCLEGILILVDCFAMDNVLEMCRNLLIASNKPKLFKFRIAHKYRWAELEEQILQSMQVEDHVTDFVANAKEFSKMDDDTKAAFIAHHEKLYHSRNGFLYKRGPRGLYFPVSL